MKVIISGMNGTLAPVLGHTLAAHGVDVVAWDRQQVPADDDSAIVRFLDSERPDWMCHVAMGPERWAELAAATCKRNDIGFLFTSTALVFDCDPDGPHAVADERSAKDDYGRYKIRCEDAINAASDRAIIARFGWQIGSGRGGNNMIEKLSAQMEHEGRVTASRRWIPATSFMTDTCEALWQLMQRGQPGTFHLDSNTTCALNFYDIAHRLAAKLGVDWRIAADDSYAHDQRLVANGYDLPPLTDRL